MPKKDTFDQLISDMDHEDKMRLLDKIRTQTDLSERQLIDTETEAPYETNEKLFVQLSWFRKIWYTIIGFFTGKPAKDVFVNAMTQEAGREIENNFPGMFDYDQAVLRGSFQDELKRLKEAARFFYTALDSSVNKDAGAFFVFLGSAEMSDLHKRLTEGTDPSMYAADNPDRSFAKLKNDAISYIENAIITITDEQRNIMYRNARSLLCLRQLASFLYDRLILSFNKHNDEGPVCPINLVKPQLIALNNILFSLKSTPSITLMSSMFVFIMQEHNDEDGYNETIEMQKFTSRAEKALDTIRAFNRRVPLTRILRVASRDMSLQPQELTGGEDWFALYRESWIDSVSKHFSVFIANRRKMHIKKLYAELFNDFEIEPFENVQTKESDDGIPVDNIESIAILLTFHKLIFMPEINVVLRPMLIDGEFSRKENRIEFTESYNVLIKLDDTIKNLTKNLASSGEYGKRWDQINTDVQAISIRKRKTNILFDEISGTIANILTDASRSMIAMKNILTGIVHGDLEGKYGSLNNLADISGKGNTFIDGLKSALTKLIAMIKLTEELKSMEDED